MQTLLIDNYDSFTFNLYQLIARVNGCPPLVIRNDQYSWDEVSRWGYDNIVISPGPGHPGHAGDFGICRAAILSADVPLLGVCLGHQGIAEAFGAGVARASEPMHGRICEILHDGEWLFRGLPQRFKAVRYHSLTVVPDTLPPDIVPTAWTPDGVLMGLAHTVRPRWGVQFHPESIGSEFGTELMANGDIARSCGRERSPRGARA